LFEGGGVILDNGLAAGEVDGLAVLDGNGRRRCGRWARVAVRQPPTEQNADSDGDHQQQKSSGLAATHGRSMQVFMVGGQSDTNRPKFFAGGKIEGDRQVPVPVCACATQRFAGWQRAHPPQTPFGQKPQVFGKVVANS
jgi:hypothetical protein